jgi:type III restriction enzyme
MNPVCIVDESHNAESDLSVEMLRNINPCFILDLTATPRNNSNIISYVSPMELKRENMVKLPVIVYNHHNNNDVMRDALDLQRKLEARANACMEKGGEYIRPIVLFQAQPKTNQDNATFEKIKQTLIDLGIGPHRIAIKTAAINELKSWDDLLAPDCPIRYIITVNALKEGWDCPFAYILASLANKASTVDVEQILGRILRQPYAKKSQDRFLNMSYVFTASAMFQDTLENIVKALNKAGFSKMDYRVAETSPAELERKPDKPVQTNLPVTEDDGDELQLDPSSIGFDPNQENVLG